MFLWCCAIAGAAVHAMRLACVGMLSAFRRLGVVASGVVQCVRVMYSKHTSCAQCTVPSRAPSTPARHGRRWRNRAQRRRRRRLVRQVLRRLLRILASHPSSPAASPRVQPRRALVRARRVMRAVLAASVFYVMCCCPVASATDAATGQASESTIGRTVVGTAIALGSAAALTAATRRNPQRCEHEDQLSGVLTIAASRLQSCEALPHVCFVHANVSKSMRNFALSRANVRRRASRWLHAGRPALPHPCPTAVILTRPIALRVASLQAHSASRASRMRRTRG